MWPVSKKEHWSRESKKMTRPPTLFIFSSVTGNETGNNSNSEPGPSSSAAVASISTPSSSRQPPPSSRQPQRKSKHDADKITQSQYLQVNLVCSLLRY